MSLRVKSTYKLRESTILSNCNANGELLNVFYIFPHGILSIFRSAGTAASKQSAPPCFSGIVLPADARVPRMSKVQIRSNFGPIQVQLTSNIGLMHFKPVVIKLAGSYITVPASAALIYFNRRTLQQQESISKT